MAQRSMMLAARMAAVGCVEVRRASLLLGHLLQDPRHPRSLSLLFLFQAPQFLTLAEVEVVEHQPPLLAAAHIAPEKT
jgi:hypothetical protein